MDKDGRLRVVQAWTETPDGILFAHLIKELHWARRSRLQVGYWLCGDDWWERCRQLRTSSGMPLWFQWADGTYDVIQHSNYMMGFPVRVHRGAGIPRLIPRG